jgi:hypothetical protein
MIEETIRQIEARLHASPNLMPDTRAELLQLVAKLRVEAAQLPSKRIPAPNPPAESMDEHVEQLRDAVTEFEDSHPKVIQLVNHLANTLAGLGI